MAKYAAETTVTVEKSKMEIERTVTRYGATGFMSGWQGERATVEFLCRDRHIRFSMILPRRDERRFTHKDTRAGGGLRTESASQSLWEQACRQKWRALALLVKAKLEAVDAGIATLEEVFFADIVLPDGRTVYDSAKERVALAYSTKQNILLLPGRADG